MWKLIIGIVVVIMPLVDLWNISESDESESDAALLKRLKRRQQTERARVEVAKNMLQTYKLLIPHPGIGLTLKIFFEPPGWQISKNSIR